MSSLSAGPKTADIEAEDFDYFCKVVFSLTGIVLGPEKYEMIYSRLHRRLWELDFTVKQYRQFLEEKDRSDPEWQNLVNLITTNKTNFFREMAHFVFLIQKILPLYKSRQNDPVRIWSCAASSGQEAYSIAMVMQEHLPKNIPFEIIATDIDTNILRKAKNAVFPIASIFEIPPQYHDNCIERGTGKVANWFRIKKEIRDTVSFKQYNLIDKREPPSKKFDIIFCRNVMIYFDTKTIDFISRKLCSSLKNDGYFFIGHSESLQNIEHDIWDKIGPSVYSKKE